MLTPQARGWLLALAALTFLALHLPFLPLALEDLDSINFALGVRDFDVARHQPHPPGYPVFVALAKVATPVLRAAGVPSPEPRGLAICGALAGSLAVVPLFTLFRNLERDDRRALAATFITIASPLFWFTANRPLSDVTGLVVALAAQALAVRALLPRPAETDPAEVQRLVTLASLVAGVGIGIRAQTFVLTLPLIGLVLADARAAAMRVRARATLAFVGGVLLWGIPLVVTAGGPLRYLRALGSQGAEDFSGVQMLWTHPTVRLAAYAARDTFVRPWATVPFATLVLGLSAVGGAWLAWRARRPLVLLAIGFVPYAIFHLLFQETVTVRYALPLVPAIAYLVAVALNPARRWTRRTGFQLTIGTTAIVAISLWLTVPALRDYGAEPSPIFRLFADMDARATSTGVQPRLAMHRRVFSETRRVRDWRGRLPGPLLPSPRYYEWLEVEKYWLAGGRDPVWFLANPGRTDLALFDPATLTMVGEYRWPFDNAVFVGGARPIEVDWYEIAAPGWFLDKGWALTAETGGLSTSDGYGPHLRPSVAHVARRAGQTLLMIGGRHLGSATDPAVRITAAAEGRTLAEWDQAPGFFLRMQPVEAGALAGPGEYAQLEVTSHAADGSNRSIPVGLEQFDLQPIDAVVWGFDAGWHEPEYNPRTERSWRWTSAASAFQIHNAGRGVTIRLVGESPMRYYDTAPRVSVKTGTETVTTFSPDRDFTWDVDISEARLRQANGRVVIETDRTFVPDEVAHNGDKRRLGLRIYRVTVRAR